MRRYTLLILFSLLILGTVNAQTREDSTYEKKQTLAPVNVTAKKISPFFKRQDETTKLDISFINSLPKILGNTDPIHYLQTMPGISTNNEYDAGIHIMGCSTGQNLVSINGIPIYNAGHLLGLFSTFNPSHFHSLTVATSPTKAGFTDRIGGIISLNSIDTICDKTHGNIAVGPMSSQGTLQLSLSTNSSLILSARMAYLNLLYGKWLTFDGDDFKYDFNDVNLTYLWQPSAKDKFSLDFYIGGDHVTLNMPYYPAELRLNWCNILLSSQWERVYNPLHKTTHQIYITSYSNDTKFMRGNELLLLPSKITTIGLNNNSQLSRIDVGYELRYHNITPQSPAISNYYTSRSTNTAQKAAELSTYIDYKIGSPSLYAIIGGRECLYWQTGQKVESHFSPNLSLHCKGTSSKIVISMYRRWQNLHQTGISQIGLPFEFWIGANKAIKPQYADGVNILGEKAIGKSGYTFNIELFYKKLYNQVEYTGDILDFSKSSYDIHDYLRQGKGYNYGVGMMVNKRFGRIYGWLSYTYTHTSRTMEGTTEKETFPASNERPHELNMVLSYKANKHFVLSSTFVYASGTPFTAPQSFYAINGNILSQYNGYNKNRLPAYSRLDLSADYTFSKNKHAEYGVNLSLCNALNHQNPVFYRLYFYEDDTQKSYSYKPLTFAIKVLPSVNFYCKF